MFTIDLEAIQYNDKKKQTKKQIGHLFYFVK
jgi:hypothetical protein